MSQIELSSLVKKRTLDVLLQQEGPRLITIFYYFPQLIHYLRGRQNLNLILVICPFSWFYHPYLLLVFEDGIGVKMHISSCWIAD